MKKWNKKIHFVFQILIILISGIATFLNVKMFDDTKVFLYYTIISNIFVFVFYSLSIINIDFRKKIKTDTYYKYKGLLLLSILFTMIIYNFIIITNNSTYIGHGFICSLVHLIIPLLVLIECLFFEEKKVLKYKYLITWGIFMMIYIIFIYTYSLFGGTFLNNSKYPYEIMNIQAIGYKQVIINGMLIFGLYELLGATIIFIDNIMKNREV